MEQYNDRVIAQVEPNVVIPGVVPFGDLSPLDAARATNATSGYIAQILQAHSEQHGVASPLTAAGTLLVQLEGGPLATTRYTIDLQANQ